MIETIFLVESRRPHARDGHWITWPTWHYTQEDAEREIVDYRRRHALEPEGRDLMRVMIFRRVAVVSRNQDRTGEEDDAGGAP